MSMDSLDWSKQFEVLSISRLYLHSLGIPYDQVTTLTDEDMECIADNLSRGYELGFDEAIFNAAMSVLAGKHPDDRTGGRVE